MIQAPTEPTPERLFPEQLTPFLWLIQVDPRRCLPSREDRRGPPNLPKPETRRRRTNRTATRGLCKPERVWAGPGPGLARGGGGRRGGGGGSPRRGMATYGSERAKKFFARALAEVSNSRTSGWISANAGPSVRELVPGDLDRPFDDLHLKGLVDQSTGRHVVKRGVE